MSELIIDKPAPSAEELKASFPDVDQQLDAVVEVPDTEISESSEPSVKVSSELLSEEERDSLILKIQELRDGFIPEELRVKQRYNQGELGVDFEARKAVEQPVVIAEAIRAAEAKLAAHDSKITRVEEAETRREEITAHNEAIAAKKEEEAAEQDFIDKALFKARISTSPKQVEMNKDQIVADAKAEFAEMTGRTVEKSESETGPSVSEQRQAKSEANTSEYGQMLKAHQSEVLRAQANKEIDAVEEVTDVTEAGLLNRKGKIFGRAKAKLTQLYAKISVAGSMLQLKKEALSNPENAKKRKLILSMVGGAVALGGAYLLTKGLDTGGSEDTVALAESPISAEDVAQSVAETQDPISESDLSGVSAILDGTEVAAPVAEGASASAEALDNLVTLDISLGGGIEDSLQDHYGLSDIQATEARTTIESDLIGQPGTYMEGSDVRILSPGDFTLNSAASEKLNNYLRSIGK